MRVATRGTLDAKIGDGRKLLPRTNCLESIEDRIRYNERACPPRFKRRNVSLISPRLITILTTQHDSLFLKKLRKVAEIGSLANTAPCNSRLSSNWSGENVPVPVYILLISISPRTFSSSSRARLSSTKRIHRLTVTMTRARAISLFPFFFKNIIRRR